MSMASAADLPTKAPAYAPPVAAPYNWTGSYIGGHFGYAWGSDPIDLTPVTAFPTGTVPLSLADNPRGVLGGIQYGTNWQFNRFVLGWGFLLQRYQGFANGRHSSRRHRDNEFWRTKA
jgi:outer membrane immunogenic protein